MDLVLCGGGGLIGRHLDVAHADGATITVDGPAVFLDAVDALCVGADIVDIERQNRVVGIDVDVVDIVSRSREVVAVGSLDEALAFLTLLFEVYLAAVFPFGIHNHRIVLLGVGAANERYAELVPVVRSLYGKRDMIAGAQTVVEHISIVSRQRTIAIILYLAAIAGTAPRVSVPSACWITLWHTNAPDHAGSLPSPAPTFVFFSWMSAPMR